jgi:hypothetical protein
MMNYLITGGTGLIGKALLATLSQDNVAITVLTRNPKQAKTLLGDHLHFIERLTSKDIENKDVVINLAGEPIADKRWTNAQKNKICQSRWHITQQLVELIKQADVPPSLFISGSAIGMYGRQGNKEINESYKDFNQEFTHDICQKWEAIALSASSEKTRVAILRTGIVLAANSGALAKMLPPFKLGLGGPISHGEQVMSWIHYQDMIAAILHIKEHKDLSGPINLTAPFAVSNHKFSQTLSSQLKRPGFFTTPAWLLKILFGEMADLLLYGQNVVPTKLINSGYHFKYPTIKDALSDLVS